MKRTATWIMVHSLVFICFFACITPTVHATEASLTRGAAAQLVVDAFDFEYDSSMTIPFTDVPVDSPYYKAICICYHKGITRGMSANSFGTWQTMSRAEIASFLCSAGLPSATPDEIPSDVSAGSWYYSPVYTVIAHGIMSVDENGNFNPSDVACYSDVDLTAIDMLFEPTTDKAANLDLVNGSITISANLKGVTVFRQGETEIRTSAAAGIIRQTNNTTPTSNTVTVESGECELTIASLNVKAIEEQSPILVKEGAALNLTLLGSSTVIGGVHCAGVQVPEGAILTIGGAGNIKASGGQYGAGIGGGYKDDSGIITITGGTVTTNGGPSGSGIGGGLYGDGGIIAITGGTVTTIGGGYGMGIDGGSTITITGGTVTAIGDSTVAGIGGGGTITITGGTVTATCKFSGAGIGGDGGTITITGGTVTADRGWSDYADIGIFDAITISEKATVTKKSGSPPILAEKIFIDKQPLTSAAHLNHIPVAAVTAHGHSGLYYQWQISADKSNWIDLEGETSSEIGTFSMTEELDGAYLRCKLTNGWGNVEYTNIACIYVLEFAQQPVSVEANLNDIVAFEAASTCSNVTYQWQRSYDEGETWIDVAGETFSTLIVNANLSENAAKYRCVITATNGDELASDVVSVDIDAGDLVTYTVRNLLQKADGSGYVIADQQVLESVSGATVTAPNANYDGFSENTSKGTISGTVTENSSLVLTRYFDRETYAITFDTMGGGAHPALAALYGAAIEEPSAPGRYGYDFKGWYVDEELTEIYEFDTMPLGGVTVYAKWVPVGADRGIEYTINGLGIRNCSTFELQEDIPEGNFLVEVSVTNLEAAHVDAILLVYYSEQGQMIGMNYMFTNIPVGYTATFGTLVKNDDGRIGRIAAFVLPALGNPIPLAESKSIS